MGSTIVGADEQDVIVSGYTRSFRGLLCCAIVLFLLLYILSKGVGSQRLLLQVEQQMSESHTPLVRSSS